MFDITKVKGILFDYGGTIDSDGLHWAEVIWAVYQEREVPVSKEVFREAYVFGERTLGKNPIVKPYHTFLDMLRIKIDLSMAVIYRRGRPARNGLKRSPQDVTRTPGNASIKPGLSCVNYPGATRWSWCRTSMGISRPC